jgi:MFS family permease
MIKAYLQQLRRFSRGARLYLASIALVGLAWFGLYAVLFNLYLLRLGYGPGFIGLVNGVGFLINALFSLPAGALGSRWGIRRMMIVGMGLQVVMGLPIPFTHVLPLSWRAGWLLATNALAWVGGALYMVNGTPFLMKVTTPRERDHVFSMMTALFPLTGFFSSLVSGLLPGLLATVLGVSLDNPAPYGYPLLIAPILYGLSLLALVETSERDTHRSQEIAPGKGSTPYILIILVALVVLLQLAGEWSARVFLNVYLDSGLSTPTPMIGMLFAVAQLLSVPAALAMPLLVRRLGRERTVVLAALGVAGSLLPLALIPHWIAGGLGFMGMIATASISASAFMVYHQEIMPVRWRPAASGAASTAMGLSSSAMAFGGGYVIGAAGYRSLFLMGAALTAAGALLFWVYFRVPRGELARVAAKHAR